MHFCVAVPPQRAAAAAQLESSGQRDPSARHPCHPRSPAKSRSRRRCRVATKYHRGIVGFRQALPHPITPPRQLLEHVRDAAGSGVAALGLSEVAAALNAGRVAHLVYDPNIRYMGTVGADGTLYGGDEVGPDADPGTPEPRLSERLVERALKTTAQISPVEGAADGSLRDAAGIAALLRW